MARYPERRAHELCTQKPFCDVLLHDVQRHVAQHGEIVWGVVDAGSVVILVHDDVPPSRAAGVSLRLSRIHRDGLHRCVRVAHLKTYGRSLAWISTEPGPPNAGRVKRF